MIMSGDHLYAVRKIHSILVLAHTTLIIEVNPRMEVTYLMQSTGEGFILVVV